MRYTGQVKLPTSTTVTVAQPIDVAFARSIDAASLPRFLLRYGPIPGAVRADELTGGPAAGSRRRLEMTDGSIIEEEITALERPRRCAYHWLTRPRPPFGWLIRHAAAEWIFTDAGPARTRIHWSYTFELTSPVAVPLAAPILLVFRRWMTRALEALGRL